MRRRTKPAPIRATTEDKSASLTVAAAGLALLAVSIALLARSMWIEVIYRLLTDGGVCAIWVFAMWGIGASVLRLFKIPVVSTAFHFATSTGLGIGIVSLAMLGIGLLEAISFGSGVAIISIGIVAALSNVYLDRSKSACISTRATVHPLWVVVIPVAAIALVGALLPPGVLWGDEPHGYDVLEYHLQIPREWLASGRITPLPHNIFSYFPMNVEMHYLLGMILRRGAQEGMYLAQLMHLSMIGITIVAIFGALRERMNSGAAAIGALAAGCTPWMGMLGAVAYNEGGLLLFGTLCLAWVIRETSSRRSLILAGVFAGLACGVKLTGVPMVLGGGVVVLVIRLAMEPNSPGSKIARASAGIGLFTLGAMIAFSPWLVRTTIWTGNPGFPEAATVLGRGHFTDAQIERWNAAHAPREDQQSLVARAQAAWEQIGKDWRFGFVVLPLALVAWWMNRRQPIATALLALMLFQFIVWIGFTHLQGRFFVIAIPAAAMLIGLVNQRVWQIAGAVTALVGAVMCITILGPRVTKFAPAIGAPDLMMLLPENIRSAIDSNRPIVLVGDARAFLYSIPMDRLHYRTVFDVNAANEPDLIKAWAGKNSPADALWIVSPAELSRMQKTYRNLPPIRLEQTEPFVLDPSAMSR